MIRRVCVFAFFVFLFACDTASNIKSPNKNYFIKYFGGDGNQTAVDLIVNSDGSFYILGNSRASLDSIQKVLLVKATPVGEVIWQKTFRSAVDLEAKDFLLTSDGNYLVVVENKNFSSSNTDLLISRYTLSANGVSKSDSILVSNAYGNSITELSDGGFIAEGYQKAGSLFTELHFRVSNLWGPYLGAPGDIWVNNYSFPGGANYFGVNTIQFDATNFYVFGYTDANYQGTNNRLKFYAYDLGHNGSPGGGVTDNGVFDNGYPSDKTLTRAIKAGRGGYLLVGISTSVTTDSLKVAITDGSDFFSFDSYGVDKDVVLQDLGKSQALTPPPNYATAFSATSYNFILTNTYMTTSFKSDILLLKVGNDLNPQWTNPVQFGGDGDDTAAAVAELPDGHIMVLGTMQLGNPPAQTKITLMKLNASGKLAD